MKAEPGGPGTGEEWGNPRYQGVEGFYGLQLLQLLRLRPEVWDAKFVMNSSYCRMSSRGPVFRAYKRRFGNNLQQRDMKISLSCCLGRWDEGLTCSKLGVFWQLIPRSGMQQDGFIHLDLARPISQKLLEHVMS